MCSTSLVAQFSYYPDGTGIQSSSNTASGPDAFAIGYQTEASGGASTAMGVTRASGTMSSGFDISTAMGFGISFVRMHKILGLQLSGLFNET